MKQDEIHERAADFAAKIQPGAGERELRRELPYDAFGFFKESGLGAIRLPVERGGAGASIADVVGVVSEIASADPNVAQALRAHFNFVELQITNPGGVVPERYVTAIQRGEIFGGAHTEIGTKRPGDINTKLKRQGDAFVLSGRKYYTTGVAFSDWVSVSALDGEGETTWVLVPTNRSGVTIRDDWNGMGQRLTASGTTEFENVTVQDDEITGRAESTFAGRHCSTFRQLFLAACTAGIVRNVLNDAVVYVTTKARPITHSHSDTARGDLFVQEAVGELASTAFAIDAMMIGAAKTVDVAHRAVIEADPRADALLNRSSVSVAQAQVASANLALQAATRIYDTGGASATSRSLNFDRHWRNIRTLLSHNPVAYKKKVIGDYVLNGQAPPVDGGFF